MYYTCSSNLSQIWFISTFSIKRKNFGFVVPFDIIRYIHINGLFDQQKRGLNSNVVCNAFCGQDSN